MVVIGFTFTHSKAQDGCTSTQEFEVVVNRVTLNRVDLTVTPGPWVFGNGTLVSVKYTIDDQNGNQLFCDIQTDVDQTEFSSYVTPSPNLPLGEYTACISIHDNLGCYRRVCVDFAIDCDCDGTRQVLSDETISGAVFQNQHLQVMPGVNLTIVDANMQILKGCRIQVERGARLDVISSFLGGSECGDWAGIEVYGNRNLAHPQDESVITGGGYPATLADHGVAYIRGGSVINRVDIGVAAEANHEPDYITNDGNTRTGPWPLTAFTEGWGSFWGGIIFIEDSRITNSARGVHMARFLASPSISTIRNNTIRNFGNAPNANGIAYWQVDQVVIEGNTFQDMGGTAIDVLDGSATITSNVIQGNHTNGIQFRNGAPRPNGTFVGLENLDNTGNQITGTSQNGMVFQDVSDLEVHNNVVDEVSRACIRIEGQGYKRVTGNILSNGQYGLYNQSTGLGIENYVSECNDFVENLRFASIHNQGDNDQYRFRGEMFGDDNSVDLRLRRMFGGGLGSIYPWQGVRGAGVYNEWDDELNVSSPVNGTTVVFNYRTTSAETCNVIPACFQNDPNCVGAEQNYDLAFVGQSRHGECVCDGSPTPPILPPVKCVEWECYTSILDDIQFYQTDGADEEDADWMLGNLIFEKRYTQNYLAKEAVSSGDVQLLYDLYAEDDDIYAMPVLASHLIAAKAYPEALDVVDSFDEDISNQVDAKVIYSHLVQSAMVDIYQIADEKTHDLVSIAESEGDYVSHARTLLNKHAGYDYELYWPEEIEQLMFRSENNASELRVSPNPARDYVDIHFAGADTQFLLMSATGVQVQKGAVTGVQMRLDLSTLPVGLYFLLTNTSDVPVKLVVTK